MIVVPRVITSERKYVGFRENATHTISDGCRSAFLEKGHAFTKT